jgi:hypothetical protein
MKTAFSCVASLIALLVVAAPADAQPGQNIAGSYRGLMTGCLSLARSTDCRKGFFELVRLADEVDAKRVEWERAVGGSSAAKLQDDYAGALARLNRAVADFNRDMGQVLAEPK